MSHGLWLGAALDGVFLWALGGQPWPKMLYGLGEWHLLLEMPLQSWETDSGCSLCFGGPGPAGDALQALGRGVDPAEDVPWALSWLGDRLRVPPTQLPQAASVHGSRKWVARVTWGDIAQDGFSTGSRKSCGWGAGLSAGHQRQV